MHAKVFGSVCGDTVSGVIFHSPRLLVDDGVTGFVIIIVFCGIPFTHLHFSNSYGNLQQG